MEHNWPSDKVRQTFIDFFKDREHLYIPSSPSFPQNDPTILFTNAGMNQFKSLFLGTVNPNSVQATWKRVANSQKCIRAGGKHNDLDEVGSDFTHHTFFEMLGNWSFGDYFFKESIDWCHELLIGVYGLDKKRLYVTYFEGDASVGLPEDTATKEYWLKYFPADHVMGKGMKDNFWEMGESGPCGGCTELHYDMRPETRQPGEIVTDESVGVVEVCNLVFMCHNREPSGKLTPLPFKHVDTGMGFERLCSILQQKKSNYDTDIFSDIIDEIQRITKAEKYTSRIGDEDIGKKDTAYRIISDHIRTLTIALADGAVPGSDGRSYVLRRILRRAVRAGKEFLGAESGFFCQLVDIVVKKMGHVFPELEQNKKKVQEIIRREEELFTKTLNTGISKFGKLVTKLKKENRDTLSGSETFLLYGSFGFPLDLIEIMAEEQNIKVDVQGFNDLMEAQKKREIEILLAKKGSKNFKLSPKAISILKEQKIEPTDDSFKYVQEDLEGAVIKAMWVGNQEDGSFQETITFPSECAIILDKSNFYAESGGQVYDNGFLTSTNGTIFLVREVQVFAGYILHFGTLQSGSLSLNDSMACSVNYESRVPITRNHTSTHILNYALRQVVGDSTGQRGSVVTVEKLRFDFNAQVGLTVDQIKQIDLMVNDIIKQELPVYTQEVPIVDAKKIKGVRAMFEEAYPDPVRVVSVGTDIPTCLQSEFVIKGSVEFCGGTHVSNTKDIELFVITCEEAVGQGERRIQAVTSHDARKAIAEGEALFERAKELLNIENSKLQQEYQILRNEIDISIISHALKSELRLFCEKNIESKIATIAKGYLKQKKQEGDNVNQTIIDQLKENPTQSVVVRVILEAEGNTKVMSQTAVSLIKLCKDSLTRDVAVMLLSIDAKTKSLIVQVNVPKTIVERGLLANDWINQSIPGAKCGSPKTDVAQGKSQPNYPNNLEEVAAGALTWANNKLI
jgi:alanyl-tRNA synthetase